MTKSYTKKQRRYRGRRTWGTGKIGTKRAKGQKGGTGLTTGWKKHKYSYYVKIKSLGFPGVDGEKWKHAADKKGFKRPQQVRRLNIVNSINLKDVEFNLERWLAAEKITKEGDVYKVDLGALDFQKIIGRGNVTKKMEITVKKASKGAVEKLEAATGCSITLIKQDKK